VNGDPVYHAVALAVCTVLMVPVAVMILAGRTPSWLRRGGAGARLTAWALLCLYGLALVNGVPRLADASSRTVTLCATVGLGFAGAAAVLFVAAARRNAAGNRGDRAAGPAGGPRSPGARSGR
jgi:hypothetical protein